MLATYRTLFSQLQASAVIKKILLEAKADFGAMIDRSRGVADGMSKGIQFLFKKNKITVINGNGVLARGKKVDVTDAEGKKTTY